MLLTTCKEPKRIQDHDEFHIPEKLADIGKVEGLQKHSGYEYQDPVQSDEMNGDSAALPQVAASSLSRSGETQPERTDKLIQASSINIKDGSGALTFRQNACRTGVDEVNDDAVDGVARIEPAERSVITQASNKINLFEHDAGALTLRETERIEVVDDTRDDTGSEVNKQQPEVRCDKSQASNTESLFEKDSGPLTFRTAEMPNHFLGFCRLTTSSKHIWHGVEATTEKVDVADAAAMTAIKGYVKNYSEIEAGYFPDGFQHPKGSVPHESQGGRRDLRLGVRLQGEQGLGEQPGRGCHDDTKTLHPDAALSIETDAQEGWVDKSNLAFPHNLI